MGQPGGLWPRRLRRRWRDVTHLAAAGSVGFTLVTPGEPLAFSWLAKLWRRPSRSRRRPCGVCFEELWPPRLFSALHWRRNISPKFDYLVANKDQVKSESSPLTAGGRRLTEPGLFSLFFFPRCYLCKCISFGDKSLSCCREFFGISVKEEFWMKPSGGSGTNCLILPLWCYLGLGRVCWKPFDVRDRV